MGYNIDTTHAKEFKGSGLFGHSVALTKDKDLVYVGAPDDDKYGQVYKCTSTTTSCSKVDGKPFLYNTDVFFQFGTMGE